MTDRHLQSVDGGKKKPVSLAEIQAQCLARAAEIRESPALKAEIDERSERTHAVVRACEEAMRKAHAPPAARSAKNKNSKAGEIL